VFIDRLIDHVFGGRGRSPSGEGVDDPPVDAITRITSAGADVPERVAGTFLE
jgi:hypothetical protein